MARCLAHNLSSAGVGSASSRAMMRHCDGHYFVQQHQMKSAITSAGESPGNHPLEVGFLANALSEAKFNASASKPSLLPK